MTYTKRRPGNIVGITLKAEITLKRKLLAEIFKKVIDK